MDELTAAQIDTHVPLLENGAEQRSLACFRVGTVVAPGPPTDPDVKNSFIRFLSSPPGTGRPTAATRRGHVAGVEIKAAAALKSRDLRGLRFLQEILGERLAGGVVLYCGHDTVPFGERIAALSICALWK